MDKHSEKHLAADPEKDLKNIYKIKSVIAFREEAIYLQQDIVFEECHLFQGGLKHEEQEGIGSFSSSMSHIRNDFNDS